MNDRFRITTFAMLALFFLAIVLGARLAVRQVAATFDGIESFARAPRAPAPAAEPDFAETIRKIDWDAPVAAAPAAKVRGGTRTAPQVPATRLERTTAEHLLLTASTNELKQGSFRVVVSDVSIRLVPFSQEPDLDALTSALKLTDSQKASISGLIDWRKLSIDALTDLNADDESKERIDQSFREAVTSVLDAAQAKKYAEMNSGTWQIAQTKGTVTQSDTVRAALKALVEKRTNE